MFFSKEAQSSKTNNLYSKISLHLRDEQVACRKRKCYKTKTLLDFSEDHKFKLQGESLDDYHLKIEIKQSASLLYKSKKSCTECMSIKISSSDPVLTDLTLGPTEHGRLGQHWTKMMEQPGERIFKWHFLEFK